MVKIAFDIGGVIVNKSTRELIDGGIKSIKLCCEKYTPDNIYIISKAKDKWIKANEQMLSDVNFFELTGFLSKNVYYVNEYIDKQTLCNKLKINYMVDDSIKVIRYMLEIDTIPMWFGEVNDILKNNRIILVKNYSKLRKRINKISKEN